MKRLTTTKSNKFKIKYYRSESYDVEKLPPDNIDRLSTSMIPYQKKVLELGCSNGYLTRYLVRNKKSQVVAIDNNEKAAKEVRRWASKVIVGDLNKAFIWKKINNLGKFDVVFASSIIEHLIDPWLTLSRIQSVLRSGGILIVTVPNIAFWRMRLALLKGEWSYEDYGILDRTHNKFFTLNSIKYSLEKSGFRVLEEKYDPAGGVKFLTPIFKYFPNLYANQVAIKSIKK